MLKDGTLNIVIYKVPYTMFILSSKCGTNTLINYVATFYTKCFILYVLTFRIMGT